MSENEDQELKRLRMQRLQKILEQKKQAEDQANRKIPSVEDKIDMLMNILLAPDAKQYLDGIKSRDISVYQKIKQKIFPPQLLHEIDVLMQYYARGMIRRGIISLTEVRVFERQVLGISSSIKIKKQGEDAKSLGDFLKDDD